MRALVTGANGLIGANLVRELLASGYDVRAFVRATSNTSSLDGLRVETVYGDVLKPETIEAAAAGCDVLFHAASIFAYWGHTADELEGTALDGALNAVEAAKRAGVRRLVLTSSAVVLGSSTRPAVRDESSGMTEKDPPPYDVSKVAQERAAFARAEDLGLDLVAVCPTVSIGPHDSRLSPSNALIITYLKDPFKLTYPGGCNLVSARDVARGHVLAAEKGVPGERYLLGSENLEWADIHRAMSELCGVPGPFFFANHAGSYLAAAAVEALSVLTRKPPTTTRVQAKMIGRYYWYSHRKAAAALGFNPRPVRRALAEAVSWLAASPHVSRELRATLKLSREVYEARASAEREEARAGVSG
jgi:dihydroflavonol-4-reductase